MPAQRQYPRELRERAVKMVLEIRQQERKGNVSWPVWAVVDRPSIRASW